MEFLHQNQLDQYKDIIQQINDEFKKSEDLEKALKEEENQLIITRLSKDRLSEKIFQVFVEVFHNISDLLNAHDISPNELEKLKNSEKCQFYFVEIYVSNAFNEKFQVRRNWIVNISVRCSAGCINKSVGISAISSNGTWFILPIDENIINSTVEVSLLQPSIDGKWLNLPLEKVNVDISYHFQKFKDQEKDDSDAKLLQLAKLYNKELNIENLKNPTYVQYSFPCNMNPSSFVKSFVNNSYQKIDMEMFSELGNESKATIKFFLYTGVNKFDVVFDQQAQNLKIRGNVFDVYNIKKHLVKCIQNSKSFDKDQFLNKMKEILVSRRFEGSDSSQAITLYNDIRKLWRELPF